MPDLPLGGIPMSASAEQSPLIETVARALYAHSNPDGPEWDLAGPAQRKLKIDQDEVAVAAPRDAIAEQIDAEQAAAERLAGQQAAADELTRLTDDLGLYE